MKKKLYFILLFVFVVYLVFANALVVRLFPLKEESKPFDSDSVKLIPVGMLETVELARVLNAGAHDLLEITGWVFSRDHEDHEKTYLILRSEGQTLSFSTKLEQRPAVRSAYGIKNDLIGFKALIPLYRLKEKRYQIGLIIEKDGKYYSTETDKYYMLRAGKLEDPTIVARKKITPERAETGGIIKLNLDQVTNDSKYLIIAGWALAERHDAGKTTTLLEFLDPTGRQLVFETLKLTRPGVAQIFNTDEYDHTQSGFSAKIPISELPTGSTNRLRLIVQAGGTNFVQSTAYQIFRAGDSALQILKD